MSVSWVFEKYDTDMRHRIVAEVLPVIGRFRPKHMDQNAQKRLFADRQLYAKETIPCLCYIT